MFLKDLASDRRIRGTRSRRRILANHAGLVGEIIVRASRAGDGNGGKAVEVDAAGGVTGAGRIREGVSALRRYIGGGRPLPGQNAINQTRRRRGGVPSR